MESCFQDWSARPLIWCGSKYILAPGSWLLAPGFELLVVVARSVLPTHRSDERRASNEERNYA